MGMLDGRVSVITGSGRGIGREFALSMAREGAKVVVNDVGVALDGRGTDEDPAANTCKEIEALGGEAVPSYDSVTEFDAAERIIGTAVDAFGKIDILVNNAGIVRDRTLVKMDESDFDSVIAVHLKGSFNCARHAAPIMKDRKTNRQVVHVLHAAVSVTGGVQPGTLAAALAGRAASARGRGKGARSRVARATTPRAAGSGRDHRKPDGISGGQLGPAR